MKSKPTLASLEAKINHRALSYPEAYAESPWGERVVKVKGKIFLFCGIQGERLSVTTKLPMSAFAALELPFTESTGYGLGKSGWVTSRFERPQDVPLETVLAWLDESYRCVAPKRLIKTLSGDATPPASVQGTKPTAPERTVSVLLVGDDRLRHQRARLACEAAGLTFEDPVPPEPEALETILRLHPSILVIDLGRRAPAGLELARSVEEMGADIPVLFAGVRDARQENRAMEGTPSAVGASRLPPGDPEFVTLLIRWASRT